jgi:nonsense-mediated mRNA decay protein 3
MADAQVALAGAFRSGSKTSAEDDIMDYDAVGDSTQIYHTRTHLGAILQPGDTVMGYHLTNSNYNSDDFATLDSSRVPDIILVKKAYPNRRKKSKARPWKLRSIAKEAGEEGDTGNARGIVGRLGGRDQKKVEEDYELFLRDIEEDPELRAAVNLYKAPDVNMAPSGKGGKKKGQYAMDVDDAGPEEVVKTSIPEEDEPEEADFPEVSLNELLEDFDEMTLGPDSTDPAQ